MHPGGAGGRIRGRRVDPERVATRGLVEAHEHLRASRGRRQRELVAVAAVRRGSGLLDQIRGGRPLRLHPRGHRDRADDVERGAVRNGRVIGRRTQLRRTRSARPCWPVTHVGFAQNRPVVRGRRGIHEDRPAPGVHLPVTDGRRRRRRSAGQRDTEQRARQACDQEYSTDPVLQHPSLLAIFGARSARMRERVTGSTQSPMRVFSQAVAGWCVNTSDASRSAAGKRGAQAASRSSKSFGLKPREDVRAQPKEGCRRIRASIARKCRSSPTLTSPLVLAATSLSRTQRLAHLNTVVAIWLRSGCNSLERGLWWRRVRFCGEGPGEVWCAV